MTFTEHGKETEKGIPHCSQELPSSEHLKVPAVDLTRDV
jgi:hypothetical protein